MHPDTLRIVSVWVSNGLLAVILACWIAAQIHLLRTAPRQQAFRYMVASLLGALITVKLVDYFQSWRLFPAYPGFPSGHEAFTTSFGASLVIADRKWLPAAMAFAVIMAPSLVWAGFHKWPDVIASAIYSPLMTVIFHKLLRSRDLLWQSTNSRQ